MATVVLDFDGVIHSYTSGWKGIDVIPDPPVPGIRAAIDSLREKYSVVVVSARCRDPKGKEAVRRWLSLWEITVEDIASQKPPARVYVDDRAICFDGDARALIEKIETFKPWWKNKTQTDG